MVVTVLMHELYWRMGFYFVGDQKLFFFLEGVSCACFTSKVVQLFHKNVKQSQKVIFLHSI